MRPWYDRNPTLANEIRKDLRTRQPNLHLLTGADGAAVIRGTFLVRGSGERVLDQYLITIELPDNYPKDLPVVREIGGKIPCSIDYHIERDGRACVFLPDDRWHCFPEESSFSKYLDGPLHNFFLGQSLVALGENWPFGEWGHGANGILEYYEQFLETDDAKAIIRFLQAAAKLNLKPHLPCPCGSGRKIRKCCRDKVLELRHRISPAIARKSLEHLGVRKVPVIKMGGDGAASRRYGGS